MRTASYRPWRRGGPALLAAVCLLAAASTAQTPPKPRVDHIQGEMAGEVAADSVILQSRLTAPAAVGDDVPGAPGVARFELSDSQDFAGSFKTDWLTAGPESDFIVKARVAPLKSGTRYYYRLLYGPDRETLSTGPTRTFATLVGPQAVGEVSLVVVTGMHYEKFHGIGRGGPNAPEPYAGPDKALGFPALEAILKLKPDFFVGTGDNVYYDHPPEFARTQAQLRAKWHRQFAQPRFVNLFAAVPTYWEKDDHDFRYDDADLTGKTAPLPELGIATFLEQVPVVDPAQPHPVTYRTIRLNRLVQIWLTEGRDYRSPNSMPDGPDKSLWGPQQRQWLQRTLLASDAPLKLLISPTPMVGPDDARKKDNHTNIGGFRHEADEFFAWLKDNGFAQSRKGFYLICGDRHWAYHSIHPSGFEEFSCGALVTANSRLGRKPGDPNSTDPKALVRQPFTHSQPTGGFLKVTVRPAAQPAAGQPSAAVQPAPAAQPPAAEAIFTIYDELGKELYSATKMAGM